jgi:hypothetical protein
VKRRKEHQREAEREPAREIVATRAEALAPPDERDERDERLQRKRPREVVGLRVLAQGAEMRELGSRGAQERPRDEERDPGSGDRVGDRPVAVLRPPAQERGGGDERLPDDATEESRPALGRLNRVAAELRSDGERKRGKRRDEEPRREQEVEPPSLDREAHGREHCDEQPGERHGRLEDESQARHVPARLEEWVREKERKTRAEEAGEQDLAQEPGLVLATGLSHLPLVGRSTPADKGLEWQPGS